MCLILSLRGGELPTYSPRLSLPNVKHTLLTSKQCHLVHRPDLQRHHLLVSQWGRYCFCWPQCHIAVGGHSGCGGLLRLKRRLREVLVGGPRI